MKLLIKFLLSLSFIILLIMNFNYINVFAASSLNYQARPDLPKAMQKIGYFKYNVKPNEILKLPIILANFSNQDTTITSYLNDGYSNDNGNIGYDLFKPFGLLKDSVPRLSNITLRHRFNKVNLKPNEMKKTSFTIKVPDKPFQGSILGGITSISNKNITESGNPSIKNRLQYSTTVLLNQNAPVDNIKKINLLSVDAKNNNLQIKMHNDQPSIVHNYKISVQVRKENKIYARKNSNRYSLAPNSIGNYDVDLFNLKPNIYKVIVKVTNNKGQSEEFDKNVLINNAYQSLSVYKSDKSINWFIYTCFISVFLLFILICYLILKFLK
ncbi:DUF916 and DUF3324 domain-containing protein [Apilactobacillus apisilvae]|uniref:DUF916 and DUF3324 domain-containing protein n=1 Tax=Apilactobacillus apisilvae TaxID=2923364 RepID=A0ABY4PGN2_9LACO|nr:DUF916 domain-containing protein [Apilactobacillus apisilvae]UQS84676.1 DUF916 and DUF3324 domain-containing protein [Apilactobacillus apisilvae]